MEMKKITYSGADTFEAIEKLEEGNAKMAEKGWYPPAQAPQDQINQTRQKFQNMQ